MLKCFMIFPEPKNNDKARNEIIKSDNAKDINIQTWGYGSVGRAMRSQRIGRGFESLYLHHAKRQAFACLFAWWSLNGEYAARYGFGFRKD